MQLDMLSNTLRNFMEEFDFPSLSHVNNEGYTVLHYLCQQQRSRDLIDDTLEVVRLMPSSYLNEKPFVGQLMGWTALHIVSQGHDVTDRRHEIIKALVRGRADTEARDNNQRTPVLCCAGCGDTYD